MRILGIDPGVATVGFGVIDAERGKQRFVSCGVITTPAGTSLSSRLDRIYADLGELITTFNPDAAAVEELFFNTNITTGISVAPIYEYTPLQVKQAVVGYGRAEKRQVIDMVRRILNLKSAPKPDDAADAVAIALCHARSATSQLLRQGGNGCITI